ncbi:MAG: hypothetical protein IJZ37_02935 [Clostridia bacterium]|nr:hypothetical protein [Clostridia bacterium]MBQ8235622.1 hypothetical protein [Clostridia bacterium]MBQ8399801.1 hypothetical protein [Clostridia bacterium]
MKFSKKTICIVAVISLLILAVLPNFTLSAIESMSSERTGNGARTAEVTTARGFENMDQACKFYFGSNASYTSSYDPQTKTTTYSAGVEGQYITHTDGNAFGYYHVGELMFVFFLA